MARLDTALIERERAWLFVPREPAPRPLWDLAALALVRSQRRDGATPSPWEDGSGWRLGAGGQRHWKIRNGGKVEELRLAVREAAVLVEIGGKTHRVTGPIGADGAVEASVDGELVRANLFTRGGITHLYRDGAHQTFELLDPYLPEIAGADHAGELVAPMPGRIIAVLVTAGARVSAGTALIVMEAMKMEHTVTAPAAGVVSAIHCAVGDQVREGAELLLLERT